MGNDYGPPYSYYEYKYNTMYKGESKVLQYFSNARQNSAAMDVFADVVLVITRTGL